MRNKDRKQIDLSCAEIILDNAKTLLGDAKILRTNGRYASALGLAVLSLEELGKFVILTRLHDLPNPVSVARFHKPKQRAAAAIVMGTMSMTDVERIVDLTGYNLHDIIGIAVEQKRSGEKDLIDVFAALSDEEYDTVKAELYGRNQNKIILWLCRGDFDMIKKKHFM